MAMTAQEKWNYGLAGLLVLLLVGLVIVGLRVLSIHSYLGTNVGQETEWHGLIGEMEKNNAYIRDRLNQLRKDVCVLQGHPEAECPPDGPADSPIRPPSYPP